jgi:hypothetical protein
MSIRNELLEEILTATETPKPLISTQIGLFTDTITQNPTGIGDAGKIQLSFGAGGVTIGGEFSMASNGLLSCNIGGQYRLDVTLRIGRVTSPGVSRVMARMMYAPDGIQANGIQAYDTFAIEIDDQDTIWREQFTIDFSPTSGSVVWVEMARDATGNNSGGILTYQPSGDLVSWNEVSSTSLSLEVIIA